MNTLVVILLFILIFLLIKPGRKVILFILGIPYFGLNALKEWIEGHMKKLVAKKAEEPERYKRAIFIYSKLYSLSSSLCGMYEKLYDILSK